MAFDNNKLMTFTDLQTLIDTEGFVENQPFQSTSNKIVTKFEAIDSLVLDTSGAIGSYPEQRLVRRDVLVAENSLKEFNINYTLGDLNQVCPMSTNELGWFYGSGNLPVIGDVCYLDKDGNNFMNNTSGFFTKISQSAAISIGNNGIVDNKDNCVSLKPFTISFNAHSSSSLACDSSTTVTRYHNGNSTYPTQGDVICSSDNINDIFDGGGWWFKVTDVNNAITISSAGIMGEIIKNC